MQPTFEDQDRTDDQPAKEAETRLGRQPDDERRANAPLPAIIEAPRPLPRRRRWKTVAVAVAVVAAAGVTGFIWWKQHQQALPAGIAWGNGRIEADEIDIDTKFAGRIAELNADIGDMVSAGQVVARMDTRDIQQSLKKSQAQVAQAQRAIDEATANLQQQKTQQIFAAQEMDRAQQLLKNGWATKETFDQRKQLLNGANAGVAAAEAKLDEAEHARQAADHDAQFYEVNIADNDLIAPKDGPIQYRVANIGEVLPAGGRVFTMLDVGDVYMDIYLPAPQAGKVKLGTDARIVLDAYPDHPIPAKVTFVASQAQFTPKTVETQSERDKLVFRIRARIDPDRSKAHAGAVRSGLPGVAYLRWDPSTAWPRQFQGAP
ncbi:MAG TPA: HlyD family efflux transporter periplasmic adaptor subunit [Bradyrhizobium sp.]|nr:HlyD family efflux transporter periplasmic adaptor subunit [Bradyrhizobium sp.]